MTEFMYIDYESLGRRGMLRNLQYEYSVHLFRLFLYNFTRTPDKDSLVIINALVQDGSLCASARV